MIPLICTDYNKMVIPLINNAKKSIDICMYDWRWYLDKLGHPVQEFNLALVRAVLRGVRVRAILNSNEIIDQLKDVKIQARTLKDKRVLHSKLVIIDDITLVIGSHNLTSNAFSRNLETSVIIDIPENNTRFQEYFNNLYGL
jgi:phosphatidylserine/phosphatidylglycerophosphate/cardiolipin synthase-like enzyme